MLRFCRRRLSTGVPFKPIVARASQYLSTQPILENFVHTNPLRAFESQRFTDAVAQAHAVERAQRTSSPGARATHRTHVDPRKRVAEALVDLAAIFLDRGAAKWTPPERDRGFLAFFASLESLGFAQWRAHARRVAADVHEELRHLSAARAAERSDAIADRLLTENLTVLGVERDAFEAASSAMLLDLPGWAAMFARMERHPAEAPLNTVVRLTHFFAVQSVLLRSSIEALARDTGWREDEQTLAAWLAQAPVDAAAHGAHGELHPSAISSADQSQERREELELAFERSLLHAIESRSVATADVERERPLLQLWCCIDDREGSFRRHVEVQSAPGARVETLGVAGFFGVPVRFSSLDGSADTLAPEGATPSAHLVECEADHELTLAYNERLQLWSRAALLWERASFSPVGSLLLACAAPFSFARLMLMGAMPALHSKLTTAIRRTLLSPPPTDLQSLPLPVEQAALLLSKTLLDVGGHRRFARIVVVLGHGATSTGNPYAAAYNCGACGGRPGGPNARLLARLANDADVRRCLAEAHGVVVPDDTWFVGGLHNTTTDEVTFFDRERIPASHADCFRQAEQIIDTARGHNALERTRRFMLAADVHDAKSALEHVLVRANDMAEVRPELNHAGNAGVIVGRRELTERRHLDRRVFLSSYDPFNDDDAGSNLEHVLGPALVVCSGINLEYLFSTTGHGAGSKAPLNVVGNVGVCQGTAGDLRVGLPSQMTEMNAAVRALFVLDAPVARVEAVLARRPELRQLVRNEWVRVVVRDPTTGVYFQQRDGAYLPVDVSACSDAPPLDALFDTHRKHALAITRRETLAFNTALAGLVVSSVGPIALYQGAMMNPHGAAIAVCGALLAFPVLVFARRYLHGERMFARMALLCVGLSASFALVATAPTLEHALNGWSLFGFSSTFLIGIFNERPTVRNNAVWAFAAYQISDFLLLAAAAFSMDAAHAHPGAAALCILGATIFKSSQIPLTSLFVRSMEGPTPASSLGYAGLSAHVGVVLLTSTMDLWFGFTWARVLLATVGLSTAAYSSLIAQIRADRKGALANATAATIGLILAFLATTGNAGVALLLCFGHAAFRIVQVLRTPNTIADSQQLRRALGPAALPRTALRRLFRAGWALRRFHSDFSLLHVLHLLSRRVASPEKDWHLSRGAQWAATAVIVVLAGLPFTPLSTLKEHLLERWLTDGHVAFALALAAAHFTLAVVLIRFLFVNILSISRFRRRP